MLELETKFAFAPFMVEDEMDMGDEMDTEEEDMDEEMDDDDSSSDEVEE